MFLLQDWVNILLVYVVRLYVTNVDSNTIYYKTNINSLPHLETSSAISPFFAGVNWSSPHQLMKTIDGTGDVVGTGCNHQVSLQHLEQRRAMFEQLHQQYMEYLPKVQEAKHMWAVCASALGITHV